MHAVVCNAETLVYLVGQNTITPHVWLSRADRLRQPDRIVFDLDPAPGADFAAVRRAARRTGDLLREIGLEPFAQVTGSKGIHVWTPLRRRATFEDVRPFARGVAEVLASRHPDELTTGVPQGRARRAHPRRRDAQRLRPDGGPAVRGAAARRSAGGHPDRVGRAVRLEAARRPLDRHQRAAPAARRRATRGPTSPRSRAACRGRASASSGWPASRAAGFAYWDRGRPSPWPTMTEVPPSAGSRRCSSAARSAAASTCPSSPSWPRSWS